MLIVLISCVAQKKAEPSAVKDIYTSPLFRGAYHYAHKLGADKIYILSAKHGLLAETDIIEPYNETLNTKSQAEIKKWSTAVIAQLAQKADLKNDEFVFLAGEKYRKYLLKSIRHYSVPLEGFTIGRQLAFYKEHYNV